MHVIIAGSLVSVQVLDQIIKDSGFSIESVRTFADGKRDSVHAAAIDWASDNEVTHKTTPVLWSQRSGGAPFSANSAAVNRSDALIFINYDDTNKYQRHLMNAAKAKGLQVYEGEYGR